MTFEGELDAALVPDVLDGDIGIGDGLASVGVDVRSSEQRKCLAGLGGGVWYGRGAPCGSAGPVTHHVHGVVGFADAARVDAGLCVEEDHVRVADHAVVGVSVRVRITKGGLFRRIVEILAGVVEVGEAGRLEGENTAVAHHVTHLEEGIGQARVSFFKLVDEVLCGQVESVSVELTPGTLEDVGERALELLAPIATGGVHVLDLPDGARPVLTILREDVGVVVEIVLTLRNEVARDLIAGLPFTEVGVGLGHEGLGGTAGGTAEFGRAVVAALGQEFDGEFKVVFDEGPDLIGACTGLLVLRRGQRCGHEGHATEGGDEAEVPIGTDEAGLTEVGIAHVGIHVDVGNLLQGEVAVGDAPVGDLPLDEERLAGAVALETLVLVELWIVAVAGTALVAVVGADVTEVPAEVRLQAGRSLDVRHLLLQRVVAGDGGGQGVLGGLVEVGFRGAHHRGALEELLVAGGGQNGNQEEKENALHVFLL